MNPLVAGSNPAGRTCRRLPTEIQRGRGGISRLVGRSMVDLDPIPLADEDPDRRRQAVAASVGDRRGRTPMRSSGRPRWPLPGDPRRSQFWDLPTGWRSGGDGGLRGADQRLAALARRSSALLSQRPGHPSVPQPVGDDGRLRSQLHGGLSPRASSFPPRRRSPSWSSGPSAAIVPSWLTSSMSWSRPPRFRGWWRSRPAAWRLRARGAALAVLLVSALRLDRLPDQLRGLRDAALPAGDPAGPAGHGRFRAAT